MIKIWNIILFAVMILMNYLANALPLNNVSTGELSDSYPNLFVPAGITFSIWGLIYLLLGIFCIIQFTVREKEIIDEIGLYFAITCMLNALWIVAWHYRVMPLSLVIMVALLVMLILINLKILHIAPGIIKAAFGIYLGWICVATVANVTALLVSYGWQGIGLREETWAIIMILAGALITVSAIIRFKNPFIGISVIWAFIGIWIKRQDDYRSIVITAIISLVLVSVFTITGFLRKHII